MSRMTGFVLGAVLALVGCGCDHTNHETDPCGDGICAPNEIGRCFADCGDGSGSNTGGGTACGNGTCGTGENENNCPADCTSPMCGNGACEPGETISSCPGDCGGGDFSCGNGFCDYDLGETYAICPADCVVPSCGSGTGSDSFCGLSDGFDCSDRGDACYRCFSEDHVWIGNCDAHSNDTGVSAEDCAACAVKTAFGVPCALACGSGESASCAACMIGSYVCGDGYCDAVDDETVENCPTDCRPFDCTTAATQMTCERCFEDDFYGLGTCDEIDDAYPGSAGACAACAGSGVLGSGCERDCAGGETLACAQCMYVASLCGDGICEYFDGETTTSCPTDCMATCGDNTCDTTHGETTATCGSDCHFDCAGSATQAACARCFADDAGTFGECNVYADVLPGSAADCAACVGSGAFGTDTACGSACADGETLACAQCVETLTTCNDGTCEYGTGERYDNCPADCAATTCGDGICDALNGEDSTGCPADCLLADSFDCTSSVNRNDCADCFHHDAATDLPTMCDAYHEVRNGSAADCAACVHVDAFGSACVSSCGSDGETVSCAQCADI